MSNVQSERAQVMWRRCLLSAFRTALACTIVGGATLFGPKSLNSQVAFPAFSYVTVILIVTDATLGDTFRCCWLALYATVQGVLPSILSLWLIGPSRLTASTTSALVGISAFVVALPENTHLISKRIALGQIVIVYVIAYINGEQTEPVMHPVHVAASTVIGVVACVLAMLFPYPNLGFCQVKENCKLYIENASERLKLFVKAFSSEENKEASAMISQAKVLSIKGSKALHGIKSKQESMEWETYPVKFFKSCNTNPGERLQSLDTALRGMEIAVTNCSEFPVRLLSSELKNDLIVMEEQFLNQLQSSAALEKTILPKSEEEKDSKFLQTLQNNTEIPLTYKDLTSLFFIFCFKLLQNKPATSSSNVPAKQEPNDIQKTNKWFLITNMFSKSPIKVNKSRLMPALKCSLSLTLAVFFGSIYSKENGFWSALPVAISFASSREATFKIANVKAQGTVLGTVYGVIGCFLFEKYVKIRFISLLPWFIFSTFLRQSKMYGQAGGISAVIGALLILGRKNFGSPSDFAIARIIETFIGLSCSIMVDLLLQPTRASVLAKHHLSMSLQALHQSIRSITLEVSDRLSLEESQKWLKSHVNELGNFIEEAKVEPNFWFLPFHGACHSKLRGSLSNMMDFLLFGNHALRFLEQESRKMDGKIWKEAAAKLETDLKLLKDAVLSRIKCFEEVSSVNSLAALGMEFEKRKNSIDLEMGKSATPSVVQWSGSDDAEIEKYTNAFLQHVQELVINLTAAGKDDQEVKVQVVLSLSALLFCMNAILKETKEIEKAINELVQWENPTSQVNLDDISCKLQALGKGVAI